MLFEDDPAGEYLIRSQGDQAKLVHLVVVEQILRSTFRADNCLGAISSRFAPLYDRTVTRMITLAEMQKDLTNDRADRSLAVLVDARRAGVLHRLSSSIRDSRLLVTPAASV
jgi:hypothetical protein